MQFDGTNTVNAMDQRVDTFTNIFRATDLFDNVNASVPYTVFAPSDTAFQNLPNTPEMQLMLSTKAWAEDFVGCHAVPGSFKYPELLEKVKELGGELELTSVGGCPITLASRGESLVIVEPNGGQVQIEPAGSTLSGATLYVTSSVGDLKPAQTAKNELRASRIFSGPEEYPPTNFAAYGILAFKATASNFDVERHKMICEAFIHAVMPSEKLAPPPKSQMVTVWPMASSQHASAATKARIDRTCDVAVSNYGLPIAIAAIRDAEATGEALNGEGPFLIAWSPPSAKGNAKAVVLLADLSDIAEYKVASEVMYKWVQDIEKNPQYWERGFDHRLRATVRAWADEFGPRLLNVIGLDGG